MDERPSNENIITAEVILPLAVRSNFHYRLGPEEAQSLQPGQRVLVRFGKGKIYTGLVKSIGPPPPEVETIKLKPIDSILDEDPILYPDQLKLYEWTAFYYMCTEGEVLKAALPAGLKPESELRIRAIPGLEVDDASLDDKEWLLLEALESQEVLSQSEAGQIWDIRHPLPRLKKMAAKGLIELFQEVEARYKPKTRRILRLAPEWEQEEKLQTAFEQLAQAPAQENLLILVVSAHLQKQVLPRTEALKKAQTGASTLKSLIEKGFVVEEEQQVDRLGFFPDNREKTALTLNSHQQAAVDAIRGHMLEEPLKPVLVNGVTGSGKTHLYINLIRDVLASGKQALYLLPEIALTKQIVERLRAELGEDVGIYHSRFNEQERVEIWQKVQKGEYRMILGVRSSIFLPFKELGMIVVDEEHDRSFKQQEPAPRYNARDLAIFYGGLLKIPILLGSATPSFESFFNSQKGRYHRVDLPERVAEAAMPEINIVDLRQSRKKKEMKGLFAKELYVATLEALHRGEQVILFQNRRGYATFLTCTNCGHVPQCINCDISLTYHKGKQHLRCHYCGHVEHDTQKCSACGHFSLRYAGTGTEKIEEQISAIFPDHKVQRMDLDTTRGKQAFQHIINRFEQKQIDILVGTQMVSKGLDFANVTVVGVINADQLLNFPDFRAFEHACQLLNQVSGRAGRKDKPGRVFIQTMTPENIALQSLGKPFEAFMAQEMPGREELGYPPFTRLIRIDLQHRDRDFLEKEALKLAKFLSPPFGRFLLGPDYALVPRVRNLYRMQFLLKVGRSAAPGGIRKMIYQLIDQYYRQAKLKTLRILIDVDPL